MSTITTHIEKALQTWGKRPSPENMRDLTQWLTLAFNQEYATGKSAPPTAARYLCQVFEAASLGTPLPKKLLSNLLVLAATDDAWRACVVNPQAEYAFAGFLLQYAAVLDAGTQKRSVRLNTIVQDWTGKEPVLCIDSHAVDLATHLFGQAWATLYDTELQQADASLLQSLTAVQPAFLHHQNTPATESSQELPPDVELA